MIPQVRMLIGDYVKVRTGDILDPMPNGVQRIFRTTAYPLVVNASTPYPPSLVRVGDVEQVTQLLSSDFVVLDAEAGVLSLNLAPQDTDYIRIDYYQWSFFSDPTIQAALDLQDGDSRYAAVDLINSILADPQGVFFKTYQTGDDTIDDGQYSIPRIQALRDEILRQTRLPENAGSGFVGYHGLDSIYLKNNVLNYQLNYFSQTRPFSDGDFTL